MRLCLALVSLVLIACQGGVIDNATPDAVPIPPDAPPAPNYLGQACDVALPCPDGWECLTQAGGNGSWCTKGCTGQADPSCDAGYTGPGWGGCILTPIGRTDLVCAIVCSDPPTPPNICPADATCNGTCNVPLQCEGDITDQNLNVVGSSCQ